MSVRARADERRIARAPYGPTLAITVALTVAAFLGLMAIVISASHPDTAGLGAFAGRVNQQNQSAKSFLYVAAYLVILPVALVTVPRLADAVAATPNRAGLAALAGGLVASLAALLIAVRLSARLPWGDGLVVVLVAVVVWLAAAAAVLARAAGGRPWPALLRRDSAAPRLAIAGALLLFGVLLCVTTTGSLSPVPLTIGLVVGLVVVLGWPRLRLPALGCWTGRAVDLGVALIVLLAVANVVVYSSSGQLPNIYAPPGVIANQQDYLLGSANQVLGGGALLVNVPVSQYGVGLIYFLYAWFHLVPISYGTLGLLDSILSALFYLTGYLLLRLAGVNRPLAIAAAMIAVVGLSYALQYPVGSLPETGPLRFGLPLALVTARVAELRFARQRTVFAGVALLVLAVSSIWAFEAFAYTVFTFAAIVAVEAWLRPAGDRVRFLARQAFLAVAVCAFAHLLLALATLAATGQLPDWGQYLAYLKSFLLGGEAGAISYGFSRWSPGLAVGGAALVSAAAVVLLLRQAPQLARRRPRALIAVAGLSAYQIALLSYADNRSSTYLLPYVTLPLLLAGALWLSLLLAGEHRGSALYRRIGLALAVAVATLLVSAAWPVANRNFRQSALAHAYPGGGLRAAVDRLSHPPPIDPRAPEAQALLDRYIPGRHALIVMPVYPDLTIETLMRSKRSSPLYIGDPVDDSLVPSDWKAKLSAQVAQLRPGQRLLLDTTALAILNRLRADPGIDPLLHPIEGGDQEDEWLLAQIGRRFDLRPVARGAYGLIVAELVPRSA